MKAWDRIGKQRIRFAVIVSLLIIVLVFDLSWIDIIEDFFPPQLSWMSVGALGFLFLFPAIPIIYGWITKKEIWAILLGVLPIMGFYVIGTLLILFFPPSTGDMTVHIGSFLFWGRLCVVACSAGYFASKRMLRVAIPVPILLAVIWVLVYCTGID